MHLFFLMITALSVGYFLFAKRTFDFFSIAVFGGLFYFSPGIMGFGYHPVLNGLDPLITSQYYIMSGYNVLFCAGAILKDRYYSTIKYSIPAPAKRWVLNREDYLGTGLLLILFLGTFLSLVYSLGLQVIFLPKSILLTQLGITFSIFCTCCLLGIVYAYQKSKIVFALMVLGILYILVMGYRFLFILAFLSIILLYLSEQGKQILLIKNWKIIAVITVAVSVLLGYSLMLVAINNYHDYTFQTEQLAELLTHSEPMVIQENLNLVLKQDYHVAPGDMINELGVSLVPFASKLGLKNAGFNALIQPLFYPGITYGTGANIWAEMYAVGSWTLVYSFMLLMVFFCFWASIGLTTFSQPIKTLIVPIAIIVFFYMQRNDLGYTINLVRNVFLVWLVIYFPMYIVNKIKNKTATRGIAS